MQRFLLVFFIFLSCGFNSGYTEAPEYEYLLDGMCTIFNLPENEKKFNCTDTEECQNFILHSKCIDRFCKCDDSMVLSSDASKCLTRAKEFGSPCEENIQCSSLLSTGGICKNNECSCKSGYHYLRGTCWRNVDLNEECVRDEQCFASHQYVGLECKNKRCKCRENYYTRLGSSCRRIRKNGESCNLDVDCKDSICSTSMRCGTSESETFHSSLNSTFRQTRKSFRCPYGMFELSGNCVRELGMNCQSDADCNHINKAVCLDNTICACEPVLWVPSENNRKCVKVARGKIDDIFRSSCQSDSQCEVFGPNSYCKDKRCACTNGTYFEAEEKYCWAIKSLKENCINNKDCHSSVTHAECKDTSSGKQCLCQTGYHEKGAKCFPDALIGDACEDNEDCIADHTFCSATRVCACREQYYPEEGKCKPGVGTSCTTDNDCAHLKNTECKPGGFSPKQCLCKNNHTHSDNYKYCLLLKNHKETCEESFQCKFHLGDLGECRNKSCECREEAHYSYGKCYKSKFIGEPCSKLQDCFSGNDTSSVICLKGFCQCNYNYELTENKICMKTNSGICRNEGQSHVVENATMTAWTKAPILFTQNTILFFFLAINLKSFSVLLTSLLLFLAIR